MAKKRKKAAKRPAKRAKVPARPSRPARLSVKGFAWACAVFWGLAVLLLGVAGMMGYGQPLITSLSSLYLGYAATTAGVLVGTVWALIDGLIGGAIFAWLYNKFR